MCQRFEKFIDNSNDYSNLSNDQQINDGTFKEFRKLKKFLDKNLIVKKEFKNDLSMYRFIPSGAESSKQNY